VIETMVMSIGNLGLDVHRIFRSVKRAVLPKNWYGFQERWGVICAFMGWINAGIELWVGGLEIWTPLQEDRAERST